MQANICPNTPHDTHPKIISAESTLLGGFVLKMNIFWSDPKKVRKPLRGDIRDTGWIFVDEYFLDEYFLDEYFLFWS